MQMPENILHCVCFLVCDVKGKPTPIGTAFWLSMGKDESPHIYLVTAKHVIDGVKSHRKDGRFYVWVNTDSGRKAINTTVDQWVTSPSDPYLDIAVLDIDVPESGWHVAHIPIGISLSRMVIEEEKVDVGDDVFIPGLFTGFPGEERNIPIIRVGNIAAMMEDDVPVDWHGDPVRIKAYLIECRSIGGVSGSPVFLYIGPSRLRSDNIITHSGMHYYLLGLVHGHFGTEKDSVLDVDLRREREKLNMGIAIVVPADGIMEVLRHPALVQARLRKDCELPEGIVTTMDHAQGTPPASEASRGKRPPSGETGENSEHLEDFNKMLVSASTGSEPEDQT